MQHSTTYADMVVSGTLLQTAIGGKTYKKTELVKVHDYEIVNGKSVIVGEHYEKVDVEYETQPNPMLLKYLAENKLSEKFGDKKVDSSKEHRDIIDAMTEEEINALNEFKSEM